MKDVVDNEILNKDEMKLGNQTSFAQWYNNEYTNDFKDCLDDCLESAKKERKDKDRQVDDERIHKEALQKCTLRNWDKLQVFFYLSLIKKSNKY